MPGNQGPWTGKVIGRRYQLDALLGRGGVGEVYRAVQLDLGRPVAVKLLLRGPLSEEEQDRSLARLEREARTSASLGHPNIVQVTDFSRPYGDDPAYLVMELLRGKPMDALLKEQAKLSVRRTVRIAQQVLSALGATHRAGIIHRDLKPENIFLTSIFGIPDVVKLLDFGLAKVNDAAETADSLTASGTVVGTLRYMSPAYLAPAREPLAVTWEPPYARVSLPALDTHTLVVFE